MIGFTLVYKVHVSVAGRFSLCSLNEAGLIQYLGWLALCKHPRNRCAAESSARRPLIWAQNELPTMLHLFTIMFGIVDAEPGTFVIFYTR